MKRIREWIDWDLAHLHKFLSRASFHPCKEDECKKEYPDAMRRFASTSVHVPFAVCFHAAVHSLSSSANRFQFDIWVGHQAMASLAHRTGGYQFFALQRNSKPMARRRYSGQSARNECQPFVMASVRQLSRQRWCRSLSTNGKFIILNASEGDTSLADTLSHDQVIKHLGQGKY